MNIKIRSSTQADLASISEVVISAFGSEEGKIIFQLICDLLNDRTAQPLESLVAQIEENNQPKIIGHILFTKVEIKGFENDVKASILCPLAVDKNYQNCGVGQSLIKKGLEILTNNGVEFAFVLGYPTYYSKGGFTPAILAGFEPSYPIDPTQSDAWMIKRLNHNIDKPVKGRIICANSLQKPEFWQE